MSNTTTTTTTQKWLSNLSRRYFVRRRFGLMMTKCEQRDEGDRLNANRHSLQYSNLEWRQRGRTSNCKRKRFGKCDCSTLQQSLRASEWLLRLVYLRLDATCPQTRSASEAKVDGESEPSACSRAARCGVLVGGNIAVVNEESLSTRLAGLFWTSLTIFPLPKKLQGFCSVPDA